MFFIAFWIVVYILTKFFVIGQKQPNSFVNNLIVKVIKRCQYLTNISSLLDMVPLRRKDLGTN